MKNLSMQEQKQIVGGSYIVKAYYWSTGEEDLTLRKSFNVEGEAWDYYNSLFKKGYGKTHHILEPSYRKY